MKTFREFIVEYIGKTGEESASNKRAADNAYAGYQKLPDVHNYDTRLSLASESLEARLKKFGLNEIYAVDPKDSSRLNFVEGNSINVLNKSGLSKKIQGFLLSLLADHVLTIEHGTTKETLNLGLINKYFTREDEPLPTLILQVKFTPKTK